MIRRNYAGKQRIDTICGRAPGLRHVGGMHFYSDFGCLLSKNYLRHEQSIKDFEVYEDDIWVLSYLKCGTTWCQKMVSLVANDLDYKGAEVVLDTSYSFLKQSTFIDDKLDTSENITDASFVLNTLKQAENMPRPRFIKSHLPLPLLPSQLFEKKAKVIFILRDPRDTAVSYLHPYRLFVGYAGTAETFIEAFLEGCLTYGSYWHYLAPLWNLRHEPNMMVTTYEDMRKDLSHVIHETASFLGKTVKEEDMPGLLDHLSFAKMKTNDTTNYSGLVKLMNSVVDNKIVPDGDFMRKGEVGDYKNAMSTEMVKQFQQHRMEVKQKLGLENDKDFPY